MCRALPSLALVLVLAAASTAHAQRDSAQADSAPSEGDTRAQEAFASGRAALEAGHPEEALAQFQEAYRLSGRPELLYNIGLVQDRLRHDRDALEAFQGYLDAVPDAANRASVEDRIVHLREEVAHDDAVTAALAAQPSTPRDEPHEDLAASPVLWIIVGVVVVGAAVGIGLGVGLSQDPGTAAAMPGPSGVVISALTF